MVLRWVHSIRLLFGTLKHWKSISAYGKLFGKSCEECEKMTEVRERTAAGQGILGVQSPQACAGSGRADETDQRNDTCIALKREQKPRVEMNTEPNQYHQGEFRLRSLQYKCRCGLTLFFFSFLFVRPPLGVLC